MKFNDDFLNPGDKVVYKNCDGKIKRMYMDAYMLVRDTPFFNRIILVQRPIGYETLYRKEGILSDKEKEYLSAVIKPFRNKVNKITKKQYRDIEWIHVSFANNDWFSLPAFNKNKMYKGMQPNKSYTLEELGL